jgi:triosephosphate isomerase (TIM)
MDRRLVIGANLKMNHSNREARRYAFELRQAAGEFDPDILQVYVLPPFTALEAVVETLGGYPVETGAQDVHWETEGAYTGEISARFLHEIGCTLVMIGHSERRGLFAETDERIATKVRSAMIHGLTPLICIGEDAVERETGQTTRVLERQLAVCLSKLPVGSVKEALILYEPRWAIGQPEPASDETIEATHAEIRKILELQFDPVTAQETRILYGGSVNQENLEGILRLKNVDGCGVGRASWDPLEFAGLIRIAEGIALQKTTHP